MSDSNPFPKPKLVGEKSDTAISVVVKTQRIVVDPISNAISVTNAGPPGPPGPPGSNGSAIAFEFTQVTPASSWVINHNLGFKPNVTVEEAGTGNIIMSGEIHHSDDQLELQFNTPRAGVARLS
jgi:hypothetical protein